MTTDTIYGGFTFSCGHAKPDPVIHEAGWGARLIYNEVAGGFAGVVGNRQGGFGTDEALASLVFPVVDEAMKVIHYFIDNMNLDSGERGHVVWRKGRAVVVASPQMSYGYLYITALLEKEGHEGETSIWDQSEFKDDRTGRPLANLGRPDVEKAVETLVRDIAWCRSNEVSYDHIRRQEKALATLRDLLG